MYNCLGCTNSGICIGIKYIYICYTSTNSVVCVISNVPLIWYIASPLAGIHTYMHYAHKHTLTYAQTNTQTHMYTFTRMHGHTYIYMYERTYREMHMHTLTDFQDKSDFNKLHMLVLALSMHTYLIHT